MNFKSWWNGERAHLVKRENEKINGEWWIGKFIFSEWWFALLGKYIVGEWGNAILIIGESAFPFLVNGEFTPPFTPSSISSAANKKYEKKRKILIK